MKAPRTSTVLSHEDGQTLLTTAQRILERGGELRLSLILPRARSTERAPELPADVTKWVQHVCSALHGANIGGAELRIKLADIIARLHKQHPDVTFRSRSIAALLRRHHVRLIYKSGWTWILVDAAYSAFAPARTRFK